MYPWQRFFTQQSRWFYITVQSLRIMWRFFTKSVVLHHCSVTQNHVKVFHKVCGSPSLFSHSEPCEGFSQSLWFYLTVQSLCQNHMKVFHKVCGSTSLSSHSVRTIWRFFTKSVVLPHCPVTLSEPFEGFSQSLWFYLTVQSLCQNHVKVFHKVCGSTSLSSHSVRTMWRFFTKSVVLPHCPVTLSEPFEGFSQSLWFYLTVQSLCQNHVKVFHKVCGSTSLSSHSVRTIWRFFTKSVVLPHCPVTLSEPFEGFSQSLWFYLTVQSLCQNHVKWPWWQEAVLVVVLDVHGYVEA